MKTQYINRAMFSYPVIVVEQTTIHVWTQPLWEMLRRKHSWLLRSQWELGLHQ